MVLIKVDTRESALLQHIQQQIKNVSAFNSIKLMVESLPIGDLILCDESSLQELVIIERKCIQDLLSSIKDGRYEEQSYRLSGTPDCHNHNIIYLVEGDTYKIHRKSPMEQTIIYSSMFSLNYYKGFSVFRSFSMEESAYIVCNMAYKIQLEIKKGEKTPYYTNNSNINHQLENSSTDTQANTDKQTADTDQDQGSKGPRDNYVQVVKKVKKENVTTSNIGEIMLSQIPGVSTVMSKLLMDKYASLPNLIQELEKNPRCLEDMTTTNAQGQTRRVNKTAIASVVKHLTNSSVV